MSAAWPIIRPEPDQVLVAIVAGVCGYRTELPWAYATACNCLIDTLACGLEALQ
jgi:2-methylcitrate dehydratase